MLDNFSTVAQIIISVAAMLLSGYLMTRITRLLKLPNVTAYILAGIIIGPYCLNVIPQNVTDGMDFIADIALAFIAFGTGEFFKFETLKKNGMKTVIITIFEAIIASILVFIVTYFILKLGIAFSIVLAALAAATAPASTVMTIRQTGAKGDFVDTLLQVVALDDVVGLVAFSVAISVATAKLSGSLSLGDVALPLLYNLLSVGVGGLFGYVLSLLLKKRSTDNRLIIAIAAIFTFCGMCVLLDVSPLLGCMSMGMIYINTAKDEKLFKQLNYFSPPILLLFFVRSGVNFKLDTLLGSGSAVAGVSLAVIGVVYFFTRIIGKYLGSFLGCAVTKKKKEVRNWLGLALIPQAGVAIGLSTLAQRVIGGDAGDALQTIILASSVLYELIGPVCAKLSLHLSKSYSDLPDETSEQTDAAPQTGEAPAENEAEKLIRQIQKIRAELPPPPSYEDEDAFTQAAEDEYNYLYYRRRIKR